MAIGCSVRNIRGRARIKSDAKIQMARNAPYLVDQIAGWSDKEFGERKAGLRQDLDRSPELAYQAGCVLKCKRFEELKENILHGLHMSFDGHFSYKAGKDWPDENFKLAAENIINGISGYHFASYKAGRDWPEDRFKLGSEIIVRNIACKLDLTKAAIEDWPAERLILAVKYMGLDQIGRLGCALKVGYRQLPESLEEILNKYVMKGISSSPKLSYYAGEGWTTRNFEIGSNRIIEAVAQSPEWSYMAGIEWSDERYNLGAGKISKGVGISPEWSYKAGTEWPDERFEAGKEDICEGVLKDRTYFKQALKEWTPERMEILKQYRKERKTRLNGALQCGSKFGQII